jgi:transposase
MIPLVHRPGEEGQADFFDVTVHLAGERCRAHMFTLSLPYSDKDCARIYAWEDLPSFLDGRVRAFEWFGGVPRRIIYDNPKLAANRIEGGSRLSLGCTARRRRGNTRSGWEPTMFGCGCRRSGY